MENSKPLRCKASKTKISELTPPDIKTKRYRCVWQKPGASIPFPGFFRPKFFLRCKRCKSGFRTLCPDSNRCFSDSGRIFEGSALFERAISPQKTVFSEKKNHKYSGVVLLVLTGQESGALFQFQKGRQRAALKTQAGATLLRPYFLPKIKEENHGQTRK